MKKFLKYVPFILAITAIFLAPGCHRKSGCPATENLRPKTNRKGEFKHSKSKSGLFPKKMKKRMRH